MSPASETFAKTDHLGDISGRLRGVNIDCMSAMECIDKYDSEEALFYVDPPYVASTRGRWAQNGYRHEMSEADHVELLTGLVDWCSAQVILSGYRNEIYDDILSGWTRKDRRTRVNGPGSAVESIWMNEAAVEAQLQMKLL